MSDGWLRKRGQRFVIQCDQAFEQYKKPTLFSGIRPETFSREYGCEFAAGCVVATGTQVTLLRGASDVQVIDCNRAVGWIANEEKHAISSALDAGGGMLRAIVTGVALIGDMFHVRIDEGL